MFWAETDSTPYVVFATNKKFWPMISGDKTSVILPPSLMAYQVGETSKVLSPFPDRVLDADAEGWTRRVRVIRTGRGALLYVGLIAELWFDPGRWGWGDKGGLRTNTTRLGRKLLTPRSELARPIPMKWRGLLPATFKPRRYEVWSTNRPQKEAGFLWSLYHCAIAENCWRAQISDQISPLCPSCHVGLNESILHRFHSCPKTIAAWDFALSVTYKILNIPKVNNEWPGLTWQQCLLGTKLQRRMEKAASIWSLLRGSVIWYCWLDRNAICFVNENWRPMKLEHLIWEALFDHARTTWNCTKWMIEQQPRKTIASLAAFDKVWMQSACIGYRQRHEICWNFTKPPKGQISWL
jgi:hypothetical protein